MSHTSYALLMEQDHETATMKALVFHGPGNISLETVPIPKARAGEVVIRVTLTTICGTDLHILKGEYPVKPGLIIGHEPVGVIHEIGDGDVAIGTHGYTVRVVQLRGRGRTSVAERTCDAGSGDRLNLVRDHVDQTDSIIAGVGDHQISAMHQREPAR